MKTTKNGTDATRSLELFHSPVREWFTRVFDEPTPAQEQGWPVIQSGQNALVFAPTGSGKTLAAFLSAIDHLMFSELPPKSERCRVLYISPLKALAVDIERNLRAPIAGISLTAQNQGSSIVIPTVAIRTGDTPSKERAQFARHPADILITTPESLYLVLTSNAREALRSIRWVIVDEIHAMVGTKRGAHLSLSLERLEAITENSFQRTGLSATQRPLEQGARFLGGYVDSPEGFPQPRPVTIVDAGSPKDLDLEVIVPVEDMSRLGTEIDEIRSGPAAQGPARYSIWPSLYPQILDLIRKHRTTLLFVNSRRLAERMAASLNEQAGDELVKAHHGSIAREQRMQIEDDLKTGKLAAIVATSSLELGIDMGSIDLVIQVEAPTSVSSAMQRIGRSGHRKDSASKGIIFPKYRGDLLACAAMTRQMMQGAVEQVHYPRNPLDVLAQQIVAMVSMDPWNVDDLECLIRRSAPFEELTRSMLENVLDMLSGRYPSDEFADLRPRIVWDRISGKLSARQGAKRIAIINGGTIPDRGLYGVFLAGAEPGKGRVGELDEEMVFETRVGETFLLGASTWRVEDITHDRVIVSPAPGESGKMPFWKGDTAGRSADFGRAIGGMIRQLRKMKPAEAEKVLREEHKLNDWAAQNLLAYLQEQEEKAGAIPDDKTIVIERYLDELGDWRICILSTFGARIHAAWTHALEAILRQSLDVQVETMWSDDGIVIRLPGTDNPPAISAFLPDPDEVEELVAQQLSLSALFASRFREASGRALLLPRRYPGQRAPLWQQRKRAADLLHATAQYRNFPILLETYRELLRDFFDIPGFTQLMREIQSRNVRIVPIDTKIPSPFASSLMFGYIGNFIYEGDAPLAERRAQALMVDQSQLRELMGEAELRELLDPDAMTTLELQLQYLDGEHKIGNVDALHDLLLRIGDLSEAEIYLRSRPASVEVRKWLMQLERSRRALRVSVGGEERWIAAEDAARYRDALGVPPPPGLPDAFLARVMDPMGDLVGRYARTRGPFSAEEAAIRFGSTVAFIELTLARLESAGRVIHGNFRRGKSGWEWCDSGVLKSIRQKSLARLRREVEPVEPAAYGRFLPAWHQIGSHRRGPDRLLEVIEQLQGYPIPASVLEKEILPARLQDYDSANLDALMSSGAVIWSGVEALGQNDGRIALYLADNAPRLLRNPDPLFVEDEIHKQIKGYLEIAGASFFPQILAAVGGGFKGEVVQALWDLVWAGQLTNDTLLPLRALLHSRRRQRPQRTSVRSMIPPEASGRWSVIGKMIGPVSNPTERLTALARQFLERQGVVSREGILAEKFPGGFSVIYPVLKALEESGKIRRGYFIAGRGAAQFADAGAVERLRSYKEAGEEPEIVLLSASDPANPYGATLPWLQRDDNSLPGRAAGARVILVDGELAAYIGKAGRILLTFFKPDDPGAERMTTGIATALSQSVDSGRRRVEYITEIDGLAPEHSPLAPALQREGFTQYSHGWQKRAAQATTVR